MGPAATRFAADTPPLGSTSTRTFTLIFPWIVSRALRGTCGRTWLTTPCADGLDSITFAEVFAGGFATAPDRAEYAVGFLLTLAVGCCSTECCSVAAGAT